MSNSLSSEGRSNIECAALDDVESEASGLPAPSTNVPSLNRSACPKVSVVIAAFNAEAFVRQAVESVLSQQLENIEVIIVDDGSTDDTPRILASFSDRRLVMLRQKNAGVSAARNAGLAAASAPYIFFLDADDILLPDALGRMTAVMDQAPHRIACFAHLIRIAEDGSELSPRPHLRWKFFPAKATLRQLMTKNFILCGAICIRTEAARAVQGFNSALKLGEDWEFWCRLAVLGDFIAMPDCVALLYRQRFTSANYQLRKSPLRQNFEAIEAVFSNPAIRQRFSRVELKYRRRLAEIDAFWVGARNEYAQGRTAEFLRYVAIGALRYPDSVLRPRLVYLFLRGLQRYVADPVGSRTSLSIRDVT